MSELGTSGGANVRFMERLIDCFGPNRHADFIEVFSQLLYRKRLWVTSLSAYIRLLVKTAFFIEFGLD